jgi:hypothetical protein
MTVVFAAVTVAMTIVTAIAAPVAIAAIVIAAFVTHVVTQCGTCAAACGRADQAASVAAYAAAQDVTARCAQAATDSGFSPVATVSTDRTAGCAAKARADGRTCATADLLADD